MYSAVTPVTIRTGRISVLVGKSVVYKLIVTDRHICHVTYSH